MLKESRNFQHHDGPSSRHAWRVPIRYKMAFPVLVLMLGIIFFVLLTTFNVFRDMMVKYKEARFQTIAEICSESLKIPLAADDQRSLQTYVRLFAEQQDVDEVRVESAEGKMISTSRPTAGTFPAFFTGRISSGWRR